MTKLTRTVLTALAALGVIAVTGVVGVASASAADTVQTPTVELNALITQLSTSGTRLPAVEDYAIAAVESKGVQEGSYTLTTAYHCQLQADKINEAIAEGFALLGGDDKMAAAAEKFGEAVRLLNEGEEYGCVIV